MGLKAFDSTADRVEHMRAVREHQEREIWQGAYAQAYEKHGKAEMAAAEATLALAAYRAEMP